MAMRADQFKDEAASPCRRIRMLGKELILYQEVSSTNTVAMQLARAGVSDQTIVLSRRQSSGQGRLGRQWTCPAGQGLMMSLILRPEMEWQLIPQLTLLCGVVVAETIREVTGCEAGIKWPNDVVLKGKKVCGILAQSNYSSQGLRHVVLGFGLNVNQNEEHFPLEYRETSTSLGLELGQRVSRWQLLRQFIFVWENHYQKFLREGHSYLRVKWIENNVTLGKTVWITRDTAKGPEEGQAVDISERGGLIVRFRDGAQEEFMAEDISLGRSHYTKSET